MRVNNSCCIIRYMSIDLKALVTQILEKKQSLSTALEKLRVESDDIRAQLAAINNQIRALQQIGVGTDLLPTSVIPQTVGDMVLQVLFNSYPHGHKANDILSKIREQWIPTLARTSLSPPLSRLKNKQLVELTDGKWKLTEQAHKVLKNKLQKF